MKLAPLTAAQIAAGRARYRGWDALAETTRRILAQLDGWSNQAANGHGKQRKRAPASRSPGAGDGVGQGEQP